jgi:bifunctional enzyme CysN/CysC
MTQAQQPLRVVIVGHVDHGKSTLIGRLFHETGSLPTGKLEQIQRSCERRGVPFEWAFLMDALQAERDQNITIDASQIWFRTQARPYVIIDAPGHKEFLKNMVTGAAQADAAFLLIAANEGVQEQSKRHGYMLSLLGIRQVVVLVNKMDLVGYDEARFGAIEAEYRAFLAKFDMVPERFIPVAARDGDNLAGRNGATMGWYTGPTVIEALDQFRVPAVPQDRPLRFPVQDIYRFDDRRIIAGRIESGTLRVGDPLVFLPGGKTSRVKTIETWNAPATESASAGESVGVTLTEQIFVERGHVAIVESDPRQPAVTRRLRANLFWLGQKPVTLGRALKLKLVTQEAEAHVVEILKVVDASTLEAPAETGSGATTAIRKNDVAEVIIETRTPLAIDLHADLQSTGRFVLVDGYDVAGGGIIREAFAAGGAASSAGQPVAEAERFARVGHRGGVVQLTDAHGAVVEAVERALFDRGFLTTRLASPLDRGTLALLTGVGVVVVTEGDVVATGYDGARVVVPASDSETTHDSVARALETVLPVLHKTWRQAALTQPGEGI